MRQNKQNSFICSRKWPSIGRNFSKFNDDDDNDDVLFLWYGYPTKGI